MVGFPKPCVSKLKLVSPGYGLFGSVGLMLLGPPTAFNIAWSSDTISLHERGSYNGIVKLYLNLCNVLLNVLNMTRSMCTDAFGL